MSGAIALETKKTPYGLGGPQRQTLLLVESHRFLREIFNQIVAAQGDWEIIGQAEDGVQAITLAVCLQPTLVVADMWLPDISGLAVTRLIKALVPQAQVILLIDEESAREYTKAAVQSGARACVVKTRAEGELTQVLIEAVNDT